MSILDRIFNAYGEGMWQLATLTNSVQDRLAAEAARKREASGIDQVVPWITEEMNSAWT